jgi:tRNA-dihydrouridine synthase
VVYNGDIFTAQDYRKMSNRFKMVSSWMIGRGLLIDPFLPGDIKKISLPTNNEREARVRQFVEDLYLLYRKSKNDNLHAISVMKELWSNLAYSFDKPVKVFNFIKKTKSFDAYENAVKMVFNDFEWVGADGKKFRKNSENLD